MTLSDYTGTGKKVRRQYINGALFYYYAIMLHMPIFLLIVDKVNGLGRYSFLEAFSMYGYALIFSSPLLIISLLNRNVFGEVVCVIDENGIYYGKRFAPWDKITEIQYEIVLPTKHRKVNPFNPYEIHACHAYVVGNDFKFKIMYAPHYILQIVKKYNSNAKVGFSKKSKNVIAFALCIPFLLYVLALLKGGY